MLGILAWALFSFALNLTLHAADTVVTTANEAALRAALEAGGTVTLAFDGTILLTNASMSLMEWLLLRGPHLLHPDCEGQLGLFQSVVTTGLILVALLIAVLVPVVNMYALFLIFTGRPISILRNRLRARKRP